MKKSVFLSILFFMFLAVPVFCQEQDSTLVNVLGDLGVNKVLAWAILGVVGFVLGHFAIPEKWTSILAIVQKVLQVIVTALDWINEKSNRLSKSQRAKFIPKYTPEAKAKRRFLSGKIILIAIILSGVGLSLQGQNHPFRIYPFKSDNISAPGDLVSAPGINIDSSLFFGASVSFDVFMKEIKTGDYAIGVIPGVGYGIKYAPAWNPFKTESFMSLDLFLQAALDNEADSRYFKIRVIPSLGILDWFHVGYGWMHGIGLNGNPNINSGIVVFSITRTI